MAGGEGTRLRPLTSNQPKPMVPIVGKPCMEHALDLLRSHGLTEVVVTLAFMPQAIRTYLGDGESLGLEMDYSVEEQPLGTAGSVGLAKERLTDTFLVISGDALCDVDLTALIETHRAKGAAVTIEVSVDSPDEVHVHGYDLEAEATPDAPAVIEFTADLEGIFDVESHTSEALLVKLVVEP